MGHPALHTTTCVSFFHSTPCHGSTQTPKSPQKAPDILGMQSSVRGEKPVAQKRHPILRSAKGALSWMEPQPESFAEFTNPRQSELKFKFVAMEQHEIIHIPNISGNLQVLPNIMIQVIKVDIGKELTGLVANGKTTFSSMGLKEVISWKIF